MFKLSFSYWAYVFALLRIKKFLLKSWFGIFIWFCRVLYIGGLFPFGDFFVFLFLLLPLAANSF
jgi:hypothetical protein